MNTMEILRQKEGGKSRESDRKFWREIRANLSLLCETHTHPEKGKNESNRKREASSGIPLNIGETDTTCTFGGLESSLLKEKGGDTMPNM